MGIDPSVTIRRGKGAQMKWCRDPRCSPRGNPACRGTFGGPQPEVKGKNDMGRPSFSEQGHVDVVWGLPRCVWARESTAPAQGNQSLWGFSPEARRGSQGASRAAPGKSGLHARGEGAS